MLYGYNYLGDPELNIWTDIPEELNINISGLWLGPHNITVTVRDKYFNVVPNARVCIQNDELYSYGVTNDSGIAIIFVNPSTFGEVDVVVTAHNFLTFEDTYSLVIEPADLMISDNDLTFSIPSPRINQQITINATVKNRGKTDFNGAVNVTFSVNGLIGSGGKQIGVDQVITGLAKDTTKTVSVKWDTVPGDNTIYVQIDRRGEISESYKWNNIASKPIYVRKPELAVSNGDLTISPATGAYVGTEIKITATIHNIGESVASNVRVRFIDRTSTDDEYNIGDDKIISSIGQDSSKKVVTTWTSTGGEHQITVLIDPENELPEFNETNNSVSKNITINYPPNISILRDVELDEDKATKNATRLINFISDLDTPLLDLIITLNTSDPNCAVVLNPYLGIDIFPAEDWSGNANITVTVDDGGVSVSGSFMVTVNPLNDAPRFLGSNFSIMANEDSELDYQVKAYDPEGDKISFSVDTDIFNISNDGSIIFIPDQEYVDISPIKFNITISDGLLNTKNEFELIVKNTPDPPTIIPINDQYSETGKKFQLQIIAIDIDSEKLYYYDNTTLFSIDIDTGLISFTPTDDQAGNYVVKITVTDETTLSSDFVFKITVNRSEINDSNGHKPDNNETKNGTDSDRSGEWYLILALAIIIVIIIIVIASVLLLKSRKRKAGTCRI
jgi:hypothetical protein